MSETLEPNDETGPAPDAAPALKRALSSVRDRLRFDTASVFVAAPGPAWELRGRVGPTRPWHVVLDPELIEALTTTHSYADARTIPGVGDRVARLGCGSVTVHALDRAVLVLDSAAPRSADAPDDLDPAVVSTMIEAINTIGPTPQDELALVARLADSVRRMLEVPGGDASLVLRTLSDAVGADHAALLVDDADRGLRMLSTARGGIESEAPGGIGVLLRTLPPSDPIPADDARRLADVLGLPGGESLAAFCRGDGGRELLVAVFTSRPRITGVCFAALARLAGNARVALDVRREAIEAHLIPERSRWVHDIHDGITQVVTAAVIQLENLRDMIAADPVAADAAIQASQDDIRATLAELRAIMSDLSEGANVRARRPIEEHIDDIVQRWRLPARVSVDPSVHDVGRPALGVALVVIREALTNAAKHSAATRVTVEVRADRSALTLAVSDDGRGFEPMELDRTALTAHFGIPMMRQRVTGVNGTIRIESKPGSGTRVVATIPVGEGGLAP